MFEIIAVTNRRLCKTDFLTQIEKIAKSGVSKIILREKDLSEPEYEELAKSFLQICSKYSVIPIIHSFCGVAQGLGCKNIHLPLHILIKQNNIHGRFNIVGASVHSLDEAINAQNKGADYITYGHVFSTDCKKGIAPRGLAPLKEICQNTSLPVYAIGGISAKNANDVRLCGAKGACIMSGFMECGSPEQYTKNILSSIE